MPSEFEKLADPSNRSGLDTEKANTPRFEAGGCRLTSEGRFTKCWPLSATAFVYNHLFLFYIVVNNNQDLHPILLIIIIIIIMMLPG